MEHSSFYGDMTIENYGSVWTVGQKYSLSNTNSSNERDMRKIAHSNNLRPIYSSEKDSKNEKN